MDSGSHRSYSRLFAGAFRVFGKLAKTIVEKRFDLVQGEGGIVAIRADFNFASNPGAEAKQIHDGAGVCAFSFIGDRDKRR